jgi:glutaminyl-tRNA synthetase
VKVIIDNYPEDKVEYFPVSNNPTDPEAGTRDVPFTKELYIEASDFAEVPPPKFFRLKPGGEVRLMGAYIIKFESVEKNEDGSIKAIHCTADLAVGNGNPTDRKVKGTIHWVSATNCVDLDLKLYDKLFTIPNLNDMPEGATYNDFLNPESLKTLSGAKAELSLADAKDGDKFQFVRMGYFCKDSKYPGTFNRVVTLKDSFKPAK